ncbi:MAG: MoaD/ThiS family protein [Thermoplasmata archaeon]
MTRLRIINDNKEFTVKGNRKIIEILRELSLNPDAYIILIDGKPVPEDEYVEDSKYIELLRVFSGG